MVCGKALHRVWQCVMFTFIIYMILSVILRPQLAFDGIFDGLLLCYQRLIPSLFPFIVLSNLLISHPNAQHLGLILRPYTLLLRIRTPKAASCLLLGIIGGFAPGGMMISRLYENGDIDAREAQLLLCCTIGSGPGFVINAVGYGIFGSISFGVILFAAQVAASLITGFVCSAVYARVYASQGSLPPYVSVAPPLPESTAAIISRCTSAMMMLCGYVICFSCLGSMLLPTDARPTARYMFCLVTELTSACVAAGKCTGGVYLACAALSMMGLCVFMQLRGICTRTLSLKMLAISRCIHLPLALAITFVAMQLIKPAISTALVQPVRELYYRLPADTMLALFLLCVAVICDLEQNKKSHLLERHKEV